MNDFEIRLPALRGCQAGRDYYLVVCPLRLLSRLFQNDDNVDPDLRAQRGLNAARIPEIVRYMTELIPIVDWEPVSIA